MNHRRRGSVRTREIRSRATTATTVSKTRDSRFHASFSPQPRRRSARHDARRRRERRVRHARTIRRRTGLGAEASRRMTNAAKNAEAIPSRCESSPRFSATTRTRTRPRPRTRRDRPRRRLERRTNRRRRPGRRRRRASAAADPVEGGVPMDGAARRSGGRRRRDPPPPPTTKLRDPPPARAGRAGERFSPRDRAAANAPNAPREGFQSRGARALRPSESRRRRRRRRRRVGVGLGVGRIGR